MEVVLLERVEKLGQMGDVVRVKDGFARNFLLPQNKARRATKANLARFEAERAQLEAHNLERRKDAEAVHEKLNGEAFVVIRQAGETGQLYGSVSPRDIATLLTENGFTVTRSQPVLKQPIKVLGLHSVSVVLHPEVTSEITVNVARTEEEAEAQARGEDVTARKDEDEYVLEAGELFDEEAENRPDAEGADEEAASEDAASDSEETDA